MIKPNKELLFITEYLAWAPLLGAITKRRKKEYSDHWPHQIVKGGYKQLEVIGNIIELVWITLDVQRQMVCNSNI